MMHLWVKEAAEALPPMSSLTPLLSTPFGPSPSLSPLVSLIPLSRFFPTRHDSLHVLTFPQIAP
jgi:hypothetical protein